MTSVQPDQPVRVVCPMETHGWPDNVPAMRRCPACGGDSYAGHYPILAALADPEMAALIEEGKEAVRLRAANKGGAPT